MILTWILSQWQSRTAALGLTTKLCLQNSSFNITCSCQSGEQEGELIVCCRQQDPTRQWEANVEKLAGFSLAGEKKAPRY